jgi:HEAT repeat protein
MNSPRGGIRRLAAPVLPLLFSLCVPPCAAAQTVDDRVASLAEIIDGGLYIQERDHLLALGDAALADLERIAGDDIAPWRVRAVAAACRGWLVDREAFSAFASAEPGVTRAGLPRYRQADPAVDQTLAPLLIEMLLWTESDPERRLAVVDLLKRLAAPGAIDALGWAVRRDDSLAVRRASVEALARAADPAATGMLVGALRDDKISEIRAAAAAALGWRKDPLALPELLRALARDEDATCRARAAQSAGWLGDPAADISLTLALDTDPSPQVRSQAALALGRLGGDRARDALYRAATTDPDPEVIRLAKGALEAL